MPPTPTPGPELWGKEKSTGPPGQAEEVGLGR